MKEFSLQRGKGGAYITFEGFDRIRWTRSDNFVYKESNLWKKEFLISDELIAGKITPKGTLAILNEFWAKHNAFGKFEQGQKFDNICILTVYLIKTINIIKTYWLSNTITYLLSIIIKQFSIKIMPQVGRHPSAFHQA